jgi:hypothetical protein
MRERESDKRPERRISSRSEGGQAEMTDVQGGPSDGGDTPARTKRRLPVEAALGRPGRPIHQVLGVAAVLDAPRERRGRMRSGIAARLQPGHRDRT